MLLEESEKLYTSLIKEWVDKIITDYTFSITSSSSLPPLSPSDEKEQQSHPTTTTTTTTAVIKSICIQKNTDLLNQK